MASQKNWVTFNNQGFDTIEDISNTDTPVSTGPSQLSNDNVNLARGDASFTNNSYIANDVSQSSDREYSSQGSYYGQHHSSTKPSPVVSPSALDTSTRQKLRQNRRWLIIGGIILAIIACIVIIVPSAVVAGRYNSQTVVQTCQDLTCHNGGVCITLDDQPPTCNCSTYYGGPTCSDISPCYNISCSNNGKCFITADNGWSCDCQRPYIGSKCEIYQDPCDFNPCHSHGTCTSTGAEFSCQCFDGYFGPNCLSHAKCQNLSCAKGQCELDINNQPFCQCLNGYFGSSCQIEACANSNFPCENEAQCQREQTKDSAYYCICRPSFVGRNCSHTYALADQVAYYAQANTSQPARTPVVFDALPVNYGNAISASSGTSGTVAPGDQPGYTITCSRGGLYWTFFTAVWNGSTPANVFIVASGLAAAIQQPEIRRDHVDFDGIDSLSGNYLLALHVDDQLRLSSSYPMYADGQIGSGWGGFLLDSVMSPLVAFRAASLSTAFNGSFSVAFDYSLSPWNNTAQAVVVSQPGIYMFNVLIAVAPQMTLFVNITSGNTVCGLRMAANVTGYETVTRGCLMNLTANAQVKLSSDINQSLPTSDIQLLMESSFQGFLYAPAHTNAVAWSVHNGGVVSGTNNSSSNSNNSLLAFPIATVITPVGVWNSATNEITVPTAGTYFIELVGQTGSVANSSIDMMLVLNGQSVVTRLLLQGPAEHLTRSRSTLVHLTANDTLSVLSEGDMDGANCNGISFNGFLLYPTL